MKVRVLNTMWKCQGGGFQCELHFGEVAGKHANAFIPYHHDTPTGQEFVAVRDKDVTLFAGAKEPAGNTKPVEKMWLVSEDLFQVVKVPQQARNTFLIRRGEDKTPRVLLFIGAHSPRGKAMIFEEETDCQILEECMAGNQAESRIDVAAILGPGQKIAFRVWSAERESDKILIYSWKDGEVHWMEEIAWREWDTRRRLDQLVADPNAVVL
jgi:hypothetical protein